MKAASAQGLLRFKIFGDLVSWGFASYYQSTTVCPVQTYITGQSIISGAASALRKLLIYVYCGCARLGILECFAISRLSRAKDRPARILSNHCFGVRVDSRMPEVCNFSGVRNGSKSAPYTRRSCHLIMANADCHCTGAEWMRRHRGACIAMEHAFTATDRAQLRAAYRALLEGGSQS